jgi:hypothetical protein
MDKQKFLDRLEEAKGLIESLKDVETTPQIEGDLLHMVTELNDIEEKLKELWEHEE